jgi:hypothetical protein
MFRARGSLIRASVCSVYYFVQEEFSCFLRRSSGHPKSVSPMDGLFSFLSCFSRAVCVHPESVSPADSSLSFLGGKNGD